MSWLSKLWEDFKGLITPMPAHPRRVNLQVESELDSDVFHDTHSEPVVDSNVITPTRSGRSQLNAAPDQYPSMAQDPAKRITFPREDTTPKPSDTDRYQNNYGLSPHPHYSPQYHPVHSTPMSGAFPPYPIFSPYGVSQQYGGFGSPQPCPTTQSTTQWYGTTDPQQSVPSMFNDPGYGSAYQMASSRTQPASQVQQGPVTTMPDSCYATIPYAGQPHSMLSPVSKRKLKDPHTYDGTGDWKEYLRYFEQISEWNQWSIHDMASQLSMSVSGEARSVVSELPIHQTHDYHALVRALTKCFDPPGREEVYKAEFRQRVKRDNETIAEFGFSLRRLAKKAFPKHTEFGRDEWILDQFKAGLGRNMREHVHFHHPRDLDEAITLAVDYQVVRGSTVSLMKPVAASPAQNRPTGRYQYSDRRCWQCGETGHIKPHCPMNLRETPQLANSKPMEN